MPPTALIDALHDVQRRVRRLSLAFGVGLVLAAAAAALLVTVTVDYLFDLPSIPRVLLMLAAVTGLAYVIRRFIVLPMSNRLSLGDVAGRVERTFPQFQDRLRSSVDILTGTLPGSDAMKARVVTEAGRLANDLDFTTAVVTKPVWYSTAAGASVIGLAAMIGLLAGSHYRGIAMSRLLRPFNADPWPKTVQIDLVGGLPERIAAGDRLDVNIRLTHGDRASRTATLLLQYGSVDGKSLGPVEKQLMTRGDDGVYHAALDARTASDAATSGVMKISIEAGDDQLQVAPVHVVQRLGVTSVVATVTAPPYAKLPPVDVNLAQSPAGATIGSTLALQLTFNKPIDPQHTPAFDSVTGNAPDGLLWQRSGDRTWVGRWTVADTVRFHLVATDQDGLQNSDAQEYEVIARPDQSPTVQIENPRRNEDRTANAVVPVQILAEDDFGIDSLALKVAKVTTPAKWELPLVKDAAPTAATTWKRADDSAEVQRYHAGYAWDLAALTHGDLKPGDVLEYNATVTDNFLLNGNRHAPVDSGKLRITIVSQDELTNQVTETLRAVGDQLTRVKTDQARTQRETNRLANESKDRPQFDPADAVAAARIAGEQSSTAADTQQLAAKLSDALARLDENKSANQELKDTAKEAGRLLNDAAVHPMKSAAAALAQARQSDADKAERNKQLAAANDRQQEAVDQLQQAIDRMGNVGSLSRSIETIKNLLDQQQKVTQQTADAGKNNLGRRPEEMSPEDQKKLADAAAQQQKLAKATAAAIEDLQQSAAKMTKADPASAAAMKQAAATAAEQGVPQSQSKAAEAAEQNQQGEAQSSQKQAEMGLAMMLNNLKEAERRKLEQLAAKLDDLQTQLANLIRRQAGHNLDDLSLTDGTALKKMETLQRVALFTAAERDASQPLAPADPASLSAGQEQTERNTRDIAKTVEAIPDSGAAADKISEAADHMERAAVSLRAAQWVAAYDPPQVQALAALQAAKKWVDDKKNAAEQKKQQQKKEAVRAVYAQIKVQQDELNADTVKLDSAPRLDDGSLKRADAIALAQLPGRQGALADRVQKLDDDLSTLDSVVYIWANKDIARSMTEVKDSLGAGKTDAPVQIEETRVSKQLDAMINDLMVKPIQSKFAQKGGGGGGGGGQCSPGLPSEAELRLLKDLQQAVNDSTKALDAQGGKDKQAIAQVGSRQSELRTLLAQVLKNSSQGKMQIGPEPDNRNQLPEEANAESVENQELDTTLLNDKPGEEVVQKDMNLVGDRMARARQRLQINADAGKVTQAIQERIVVNLGDLIEMARKKQAQSQSDPNPQKSPAESMAKAKPDSGVKPQNQQQADAGVQKVTGQKPAQDDTHGPPGSATADRTTEIRQSASEWGAVSPRTRQAVIDGATEQPIDKYKTLVDDYYRSLATKANAQ